MLGWEEAEVGCASQGDRAAATARRPGHQPRSEATTSGLALRWAEPAHACPRQHLCLHICASTSISRSTSLPRASSRTHEVGVTISPTHRSGGNPGLPARKGKRPRRIPRGSPCGYWVSTGPRPVQDGVRLCSAAWVRWLMPGEPRAQGAGGRSWPPCPVGRTPVGALRVPPKRKLRLPQR